MGLHGGITVGGVADQGAIELLQFKASSAG
jgi:hypothetical protein